MQPDAGAVLLHSDSRSQRSLRGGFIMQKCPYCKIEVGGSHDKCPLCQSRLMGDREEDHFPVRDTLQFRSFIYKLQMFIVMSVVIAGLGLDFLFHLKIPAFPELHWSLLLAMWLIAYEFVIMPWFIPETGSARKVTMMVFLILGMLLITAYFFGIMWLAWDWIVPIVITGMMAANFVLAMVDRHGNDMAYLIFGLIFGLIPCIILYIVDEEMPIAWMICMIVGTEDKVRLKILRPCDRRIVSHGNPVFRKIRKHRIDHEREFSVIKVKTALSEKNDLHRASPQFCFFYELYHEYVLKNYS